MKENTRCGAKGVNGIIPKFIGIERIESYFDIACRRISDALRQPDMFIEKPKPVKQESLFMADSPSHPHSVNKARHGDDLAGEVVSK